MVYGNKKHNAIQSKTPGGGNQRKGKAKKIIMCVKDKSYVMTLKNSSWDSAIQNSPWKWFSKVSCMWKRNKTKFDHLGICKHVHGSHQKVLYKWPERREKQFSFPTKQAGVNVLQTFEYQRRYFKMKPYFTGSQFNEHTTRKKINYQAGIHY